MALIHCPECGHENSQAAIACPNCGRPINGTVSTGRPIHVTSSSVDGDGFPVWAAVPLVLAVIALIFLLFYALRYNDETADTNLNVNVTTRRTASADDRRSTSDTVRDGDTSSDPSRTGTAPPSDLRVVGVPGSQTTVSNKGRVEIQARVITANGTPQTVRNEKFYLLGSDLETILSDAGLDPIAGQTLANSFGLSILQPDRYGSFQREALAAINRHIKYSGTTDGSGKLTMPEVDPDNYYLFGITRTGRGFALWSSPVAITSGDNILNLSPQQITEIETRSDE